MKLRFKNFAFDLGRVGQYIENDPGLETLVIISLFTNKRAQPDEIEDTDLQGWWAEDIGSLLWTLERQKLTEVIAENARDFCLEALQWLILEEIAESIECETEIEGRDRLNILIKIFRGEQPLDFKFNYLWEGQGV